MRDTMDFEAEMRCKKIRDRGVFTYVRVRIFFSGVFLPKIHSPVHSRGESNPD